MFPGGVRGPGFSVSWTPAFAGELKRKITMAEITAANVKELRERTGAGMMDCK